MGTQLEGKNGTAVLDELIRQLKRNENVCRMLDELGSRELDALVARLVEEIEQLIKWQHLQHELLAKTIAAPPAPTAKPEAEAKPEPKIQLKPDPKPRPVVESKPGQEPKPRPKAKPRPIAPAEAPVVQPVPQAGPPEKATIPESTLLTSEPEHRDDEESDVSTQKQPPRVPSDLGPEDYLYLHGACRIEPEETPSTVPFLLEEKGIDNRTFAFALDYQRLRFYGSKLNRESTNVTSNGLLLLNKQEKVRMRGAHESILNDLRLHGILLPFEFGTVVNGPDELKKRIAERFADIEEAVNELRKTRWWNLTVYALDSRTAELVGSSTPAARRETDRGRVPYSSPASPKRIDVKTLERILGKQKKAAESVHAALQPYAERSDIDMMVSLQSGSSDDWKIILKASYELNPSILTQFVRTVTDLQYQHFLLELMVSLTGNVESFSFLKP